MDILNFQFSGFAIYKFIIVAIILFSIFRGIHFIVPFIVKRGKRQLLHKHLPMIEIFSWTIFFAWSIQYLHQSSYLFVYWPLAISFIFILIISWYALRDIVAGMIIKSNKNFSVNEVIRINEYTGKITHYGHQNLTLMTETGESIYFPYSKIIGCTIIKANPAKMILGHSFSLTTNKDLSLSDTIDKLRISIMYLPWCSVINPPTISPNKEHPDYYSFNITIYTPEKEYFHTIENEIRKTWELKIS